MRAHHRGHAEVNRLSMHYEVHGTGAPMALTHGALGTIGSRFQQLLPTSQTHGK